MKKQRIFFSFLFFLLFTMSQTTFSSEKIGEEDIIKFQEIMIKEFADSSVRVKNFTKEEVCNHLNELVNETNKLLENGSITEQDYKNFETSIAFLKNEAGTSLSEFYLDASNEFQTLDLAALMEYLKINAVMTIITGIVMIVSDIFIVNSDAEMLMRTGVIVLVGGLIFRNAVNFASKFVH